MNDGTLPDFSHTRAKIINEDTGVALITVFSGEVSLLKISLAEEPIARIVPRITPKK